MKLVKRLPTAHNCTGRLVEESSNVKTMNESFSFEERAAWIHLLRGHASVIRRLDAELRATNNLSVSSFEALLHLRLAGDEPIRLSTLANRLVVTRSGITRLVDTLEGDGLVERKPDPCDGRASLVSLTPTGNCRLDQALPTQARVIRQRFLECYSTRELAVLTELLGRLVEEDSELMSTRGIARPG
jgi:DNA-binding MarR family transcriptional regulator